MAMTLKSPVFRWAIAAAIMGGLGAPAYLQAEGTPGESAGRDKPWANLISQDANTSTAVPTREQSMGAVSGEALPSTWERAQQNPQFLLLSDQIDSNDQRLMDARNRVEDLNTMVDQAWEELSPSAASGFQPTGSGYNYGAWTPAISTQTADFRQDRTYSQDFFKVMEVHETNKFTNGTRLARSYNVNETRTLTESRIIDVANNPGGGTDGWSAGQNVGSPTGCSTWSPATSTVNQGQTFTQTRNCTQTQRSFIYYLADGDLLETRSRDIGVNAPQSRLAVGTRNNGVWQFNRFATSQDRATLTTTSCPMAWGATACTSQYNGNSCGSVGSEVIETSSLFAGGTTYIVYRCEAN